MKIGIFGYGRWSKIYIKEIIRRFTKINLYIFSLRKIKTKNKKLIFTKNKNYFNNKKIKFILVLNSTKDHINSIKTVQNKDTKILVEKPLSNNPFDFFELRKKNTYLGLQYSYSNYLLFLKKILKKNNEKIISINLTWIDSHLEKKKHNLKIHFIEDVYYHFFSIYRIFISIKKMKQKKIEKISKNRIKLSFGKSLTSGLYARINYNKKRLLKVYTKNNIYSVNFLDVNKVVINRNGKVLKIFYKNNHNLIRQFDNFIKSSRNLEKNSLVNLSNLFDDLLIIKNKLF